MRLSWSPKARYFISPDTKITSLSEYDDLSVLTTTDPFSPNMGEIPILVIKIPNNAKIINWVFIIFLNLFMIFKVVKNLLIIKTEIVWFQVSD